MFLLNHWVHYLCLCDIVQLEWSQHHLRHVKGIVCINLGRLPSVTGYLIEGCDGTYTVGKDQSTNGICIDTQTTPTNIRSNLYFRLEHVAIGKYYFDCHTEDGAVFPAEVVACKYSKIIKKMEN